MRSTAVILMMALSAACAFDDVELGGVEQEGTFSQGTFSQGTFSQGTFGQGSEKAVWGFRYTGWSNTGMRLKSASVSAGQLRAAWDRSDSCGGGLAGLTRGCEWWGAGAASCAVGTPVTVRGGGCGGLLPRSSMLRVCAGGKPCDAAAALAATDAACVGTTNPAVAFTCPHDGRYFVMVAPATTGATSFSYSVVTTPTTTVSPWLVGDDFEETLLDGLRDTNTAIRYRITGTQPVTEDPRRRSDFYTLVEQATGTPLCLGENLAIPFLGRWTDSGHLTMNTNSFTLGCTIGVLAKCYRLGYRPWDVDAAGRSLRDYHQACTRAARADFCGDGTSYTVDGTLIDLYDRLSHVDPDPTEDGLVFEAIWVRDDAYGNDEIVGPRAPVCLSKKRWDTLPYGGGGSCPAIVDPRTDVGDDVPSPFCDERTAEGWFAADPAHLLATESAYNDAGLWRWRKLGGGDYRSTSLCTTTGSSPCSRAYLLRTSSDEPRFVGAIYHSQIADVARPAATIPLYSFRSIRHVTTGDYLTTTDASVAGYGSRQLEGYILDTSCEATGSCPAKRLDLMVRNGDYLTTTPLEPVLGYTYVKTLGYLPR